jgi:sulfotransferase
MAKIHFISGLPRSGSTLLAALLRQNPKFHASMTSPLYGIFAGALANMSGRNEASVFVDDDKRKAILGAIVSQYYGNFNMINPGLNFFDTSRSWTTKCGILFDLFPDARMICMVRNLAWIVNSFEEIIQKNKYEPSRMFGFDVHSNVYQRANKITAPEGIVGSSYNNLREAFFGPHSDKLLLIDYATLVQHPYHVLEKIYAFIGEPMYEFQDGGSAALKFTHDFNNVEYSADEFDRLLNTPGLHTVKRKVAPPDPMRRPIIPPDIFEAHSGQEFWNNEQVRAKSNAIVI